jgi:hypothetical protein
MKTESERSFVVKAERGQSEDLCSHEHLRKFIMTHLVKFNNSSDPELDFGSDLDFEQAA